MADVEVEAEEGEVVEGAVDAEEPTGAQAVPTEMVRVSSRPTYPVPLIYCYPMTITLPYSHGS